MAVTRRQAFHFSAAAALFGLPALPGAAAAPSALPPADLLRRDPEAFWTRIRNEQFLLPDWRAFLNNGSLGVAPRPVLAAIADYLDRGAGLNLTEYPRWGYEPWTSTGPRSPLIVAA